jgi:uncharacterized protein YcfJ
MNLDLSIYRRSGIAASAIAAAALALACGGAAASEFGTVVSSRPVFASVPAPQTVCADEPVVYAPASSGAGALIGGIAGAAIGSNFGGGLGRAAATGIGLVAGSAIGDRIEANAAGPAVTGTAQRCRQVTRYERRAVAWDVVYDYQGQRRSARVSQEPGERIALDVQVAPSTVLAGSTPAYGPPTEIVYAQPQPQVIYAPEAYYGPRVVLSPWPYYVGGGGWHGHRH